MPKDSLISATKDVMAVDCPAPRALWILPQDSLPASKKANCMPVMVHTFYINIIVQCIRDQFQLSKGKTGELELTGQYMELIEARDAVKRSVLKFGIDQGKSFEEVRFNNIIWAGDQMLYPTDEDAFLSTAIKYEINIY